MYSIFIIDDDPLVCTLIEDILSMKGLVVRSANDGQSGLNMIRNERPDLILCDIIMPSMDGYAVLDILKHEDTLADIPFIFVTCLAERTDMRRGMSAGADDYLTKPFTAEELEAAVFGRLHRYERARNTITQTSFKEERAILLQQISTREREVLMLVGVGATSRQIADHLGICIRTVEVHRSNLMNKLDVNNAATLTRWAVIAEQMKLPN